jgi:hypothetical protein
MYFCRDVLVTFGDVVALLEPNVDKSQSVNLPSATEIRPTEIIQSTTTPTDEPTDQPTDQPTKESTPVPTIFEIDNPFVSVSVSDGAVASSGKGTVSVQASVSGYPLQEFCFNPLSSGAKATF